VNALADPQVGNYLNRHFVSGFQKVGAFRIVAGQKQGGNVAAYFCTPDGRVLHVVAGPVDADTLLREARWVKDAFQMAELNNLKPTQLPDFFRKAHRERLQQEANVSLPDGKLPRPGRVSAKQLTRLLAQNAHLGLGNQSKVHLLLAVAPLPRREQVYPVVFETILNERILTNPVAQR
jgi:hypothetical protein